MMLKLKNILFPWYTKWTLYRNKTSRVSPAYGDAEKVGILYTYENKQKHLQVINFARQLKKQYRHVSVLCYLPNHQLDYDYKTLTLSPEDISITGHINDKKAADFLSLAFDYLYLVNLNQDKIINYLLSISNAKCRVGFYTPNQANFFELMINLPPEKWDIEFLIQQMFNYTQKIQGYEK